MAAWHCLPARFTGVGKQFKSSSSFKDGNIESLMEFLKLFSKVHAWYKLLCCHLSACRPLQSRLALETQKISFVCKSYSDKWSNSLSTLWYSLWPGGLARPAPCWPLLLWDHLCSQVICLLDCLLILLIHHPRAHHGKFFIWDCLLNFVLLLPWCSSWSGSHCRTIFLTFSLGRCSIDYKW